VTDEAPVDLGAPLEPMSTDDIVRYARGVITQEYMLADVAQDRDWQHSLMLLMSAWKKVPANASTVFLVPMAAHAGGRWLNGRVPGVTLSAVCVPLESVEALISQCDKFYDLLHPGETRENPDA
jgi:hypothetical protein